MPLRVLVAVDRPEVATTLTRALAELSVSVETLDATRGRGASDGRSPDLVIASREALGPDPETGVDRLRGSAPAADLVVLDDESDEVVRARLVAAGCLAVLSAHLSPDRLAPALDALLRRRRPSGERRGETVAASDGSRIDDFASESVSMANIAELARRVAHSHTSVLILGETGVGKGRLARAIHNEGPRANGPFVPLHCAAVPESLFESELFGHSEGAFTGATRSHRGYFEEADQGTLFLDELGEIPPHIQVKLLRVLEAGSVKRVGAETATDVNVRVIAATNRDLEEAVNAGTFRADLFFRLAVVTLVIPPLRERVPDIEHLVRTYLEHFRLQLGRPDMVIDDAAFDLLRRHTWPGNVRELINAIERAVLLSLDNTIRAEDLPRRVVASGVGALDLPASADGSVDAVPLAALMGHPLAIARAELVASFEKSYLERLLRETRGRVGATAKLAGINQRQLYEMMKRHGLKKEPFRD